MGLGRNIPPAFQNPQRITTQQAVASQGFAPLYRLQQKAVGLTGTDLVPGRDWRIQIGQPLLVDRHEVALGGVGFELVEGWKNHGIYFTAARIAKRGTAKLRPQLSPFQAKTCRCIEIG